MKHILLVLAILALPQWSFAETESYSCRDNKGRLHVADNLMHLPEECRYQADTRDPKDPSKVNYIPQAAQAHKSHNDFKDAINQDQQETRQRENEAESLIAQTKELASSFEAAVIKRRTALRNKKTGFRETIILADQGMQNARKEKEVLLKRLSETHLTSTQREQIEGHLNKIQN